MALGLSRRGFVGVGGVVAVMLTGVGLAWACLPPEAGLPEEPEPRPVVSAAAREAAVDQSLRFRETFGLRRDLAHVRGLVDGSVPVASYGYGAPLTAAEHRKVQWSFEVSDAADIVQEYGDRSAPRSFGGAYIDQAQGGLVYVGFTEAPERHLAELRRLFAHPAKLRLFQVSNTETELDEVHTAVSDAGPDLAAERIDVLGVNTAVKSNVIEVDVRPYDKTTVAKLERRFGSGKIRVFKNRGRITN